MAGWDVPDKVTGNIVDASVYHSEKLLLSNFFIENKKTYFIGF